VVAVLLIEDVPIVRTTLRKFLERAGYAVSECEGGESAWTLMNQDKFDVVVTDIWMKDGDGIEFIHRLQTKGAKVPVIAITGGDPRSPQAASGEAAERAGASHVLMKPVTKAVLLETVAACVVAPENSA
jgi:CheY-like chemotaxis protein